MSKEAMKLALEVLIQIRTPLRINTAIDAYDVGRGITALREALAEQPAQQEPVAWMDIDENGTFSNLRYWSEPDNRHEVALYTSPPAQRKPLTFSKLCDIEYEITHRDGDFSILRFARAIEAAHGIKENT